MKNKRIRPFKRGKITGTVRLNIKKLRYAQRIMGGQTPPWLLDFIATYEPYLDKLEDASNRRYTGSDDERKKAKEEFALLAQRVEGMWNFLGKKNHKAFDKIYYRNMRRAILWSGRLVGGFPS